MSKEVKGKAVKTNSYESLQALFFSGKVKPSLNKIIAELEKDPSDLNLTLLACKCLVRGKDFEKLSEYADTALNLDSSNPEGLYFKGIALQNTKGKEQEALKNFNEALTIDPENVVYLQDKAATHLALFTDYQLPPTLAEKHRVKGETSLLQVVALIEAKETATYREYQTVADVSTTLKNNVDAKRYYIKAVNAFEKAEEVDKNMNIFKDIIKAQKACVKLMAKYTEF